MLKQRLCNLPLVLKIVIIIFVFMTSTTALQNIEVKAVKDYNDLTGFIDLSNDNSDDFYKSLDGKWLYFDQMLLFPIDIYNYIQQTDYKPRNLVNIPTSFKKITGNHENFGTFSVRVKIPDRYIGKPLAIYIEYQQSAYRLFADRTEIATNGEVGTSSATHRAERAPTIGYFVPFTNDVQLTMQVSNYDHYRGGFEQSIFIGEAAVVSKKFNTSIIWIFMSVGCIFIMGLFMVLFSLYQKKERSFFLLGAFSIWFALRAFFADPFLYMLTTYNISYKMGTMWEYIFTDLAIICFVLLVSTWYMKGIPQKIFRWSTIPIFILIIPKFFVDTYSIQLIFTGIVCLVVGLLALLIVHMIDRRRDFSRGDLPNLFGVGIVGFGLLNDYLYARGIINTGSIALFAVIIFVIIQVISMSKEFARTVVETEKLNESLTKLNATLDEQVNTRTRELQLANTLLAEQAHIDSLTGVFNRHRFNAYIGQAFRLSRDTQKPLSIIMIDIDEFKKYNDHYGHIKGDELLQKMVSVMSEILPNDSLLARYGGEEFIVVIPNYSELEAYEIAELMRKAIENEKYPHQNGKRGYATISLGVAGLNCKDEYFASETELVDAADRALYRSKHAGRNCSQKFSSPFYE